MRAVLADTERAVRRALRVVLTQDLGMQVVAEVETAQTLQQQVEEHRPDLLVVDRDLIATPAAVTLATLRRFCPGLYIVVLSLRPETGPDTLAAGADAFVSKVAAPDQVVDTLRGARPHSSDERGLPRNTHHPTSRSRGFYGAKRCIQEKS